MRGQRGIANKLLSDGIFQAFGKFIQQSTMVMSMTFLKSKYRKQEFELAAYETLFLKYKKEGNGKCDNAISKTFVAFLILTRLFYSLESCCC